MLELPDTQWHSIEKIAFNWIASCCFPADKRFPDAKFVFFLQWESSLFLLARGPTAASGSPTTAAPRVLWAACPLWARGRSTPTARATREGKTPTCSLATLAKDVRFVLCVCMHPMAQRLQKSATSSWVIGLIRREDRGIKMFVCVWDSSQSTLLICRTGLWLSVVQTVKTVMGQIYINWRIIMKFKGIHILHKMVWCW